MVSTRQYQCICLAMLFILGALASLAESRSLNEASVLACLPATALFRYEDVSAVPSTMDWKMKDAVTPIKDQGQCGCYWAFSAVAAMEGITQLKTGKLIPLSEQELVDCNTSGEDQGCEVGLLGNAFDFLWYSNASNVL